jgi:hypothetical protein
MSLLSPSLSTPNIRPTSTQTSLGYLSNFFEVTFNSSFLEGETQGIRLDDVSNSLLGLQVNRIYTPKD